MLGEMRGQQVHGEPCGIFGWSPTDVLILWSAPRTHTHLHRKRAVAGRPKIAAIAVQKTEADPMGVSSETLVLQNRLRMSRVKRLLSRVQVAQADV